MWNRRVSRISAQIATAVSGPTPYYATCNARRAGWRRPIAVARSRTRIMSAVSRSIPTTGASHICGATGQDPLLPAPHVHVWQCLSPDLRTV
jgi:hypothetical protein